MGDKMKYPYMAYSDRVTIQPLFTDLTGDPYVVDLSVGSPVFDEVDIHDQQAFQAWLHARMDGRHTWGVASYLEDRQTILCRYPQMREEERWFHLGLDIIVDLDTPLHAPLDSVVQESSYEDGEGNYGCNVLLRHDSPHFETFYSLYGHLKQDSLPRPGTALQAGEAFARIGDFEENGNWFYHTHLQVITRKGYEEGWISKGYCSARDLPAMDRICPSPLPLFRR